MSQVSPPSPSPTAASPIPAQPLAYASHQTTTCPLCRARPTVSKTIYGYPVCKKCFYAFANRRQLGYLLDSIIFTIPVFAIVFFITSAVLSPTATEIEAELFGVLIGIPLSCLFLMKDGFKGQSPGKMASGVVVLDDVTNQPIGFGRSFKRNAILLLGSIPFVGGIVSLVVVITIAVQVGKGYRWGDKFAQTKVIWKKYAHHPMFGGTALVCETCGYDLQGNRSGTCPECGTAVSSINAARLAMGASPVVGAPVRV